MEVREIIHSLLRVSVPGSSLGSGSGPEVVKGSQYRKAADLWLDCSQVTLSSSGCLHLYLNRGFLTRITLTAFIIGFYF